MMHSYCGSIGSCLDAFMLINSPMFRKGIHIESVIPDLMFRGIVAKFESRLEEMLEITADGAGL